MKVTEWVVINIQDGDKERSVFKTAMYQLSHCGISKKTRPVAWFGVCSSKIKVPEMEEEKHICPCCGFELVQLRFFWPSWRTIKDTRKGKRCLV